MAKEKKGRKCKDETREKKKKKKKNIDRRLGIVFKWSKGLILSYREIYLIPGFKILILMEVYAHV